MKLITVAVVLLSTVCCSVYEASNPPVHPSYLVITDYLSANTGKDLSDEIQRVIDEHPNRTIYFPDGKYCISKPILTPADPNRSVSLSLSNYAHIMPVDAAKWQHDEAMIRLGGKLPANKIAQAGSLYFLEGGIIDGLGVAKGVSIDSGRETMIRNTSIINTVVGIHIKFGANYGSSDSDIQNVNIDGNNQKDCIGVLVEGFDNTFTNMRIAKVHIGVLLRTGGNSLRNIHPLCSSSQQEFESSCGFVDEGADNFYSFCYSDQFATAFSSRGNHSTYTDCFCFWYSNRGEKHTVFHSSGAFSATVTNLSVGMTKSNAAKQNVVLSVGKDGGKGKFVNLHITDASVITDQTYKDYVL